ncbi:DUF5677 domain-containing protein [Gloeocapsopsis dulcis]|uniref:Uncharacterized protein n=1 Tax=Gloeocapsopsis dulcis AAB1 = 1H9 TaxID=1433147 RepID=A0A6N8FXD1_9CHRO|nr:DUF5677 domain-containing protein [Gloeocapsopsis dulcis]MUL36586.1 hypothetical protein [Gloeocapsopsis dulcis AAB1 = 1H9]WNN87211.1 DUF5677 domain-containing protein [Gloeocapsopsis dulcis]
MTSEKNVSSLSDHKLHRRQGRVISPINDSLGDQLRLSSWAKERMPEYLWLGLILMEYRREEGFQKAGAILNNISTQIQNLSKPKLSQILELPYDEQASVFQIILEQVEPFVLSPLTVLYRARDYPQFNEAFNVPEINFEVRLKQLTNAIEIYSPHQSNEATDLRFLTLELHIFAGRIHISKDAPNALEALSIYPYTSHDDERMKMYRPTIRAMEGSFGENEDGEFTSEFWKKIGMITRCNPTRIMHDENTFNYQPFIEQYRKVLEYVTNSYKTESLLDDRFDVIIGSITYALRLFSEIYDNNLGNGILGRYAIRTIIEILIILKYLLKRENDHPKIWEEYKLYGISKYKLVLLKARENELEESAHFVPPLVDMLVNEIKWEEFIDVDLKYFDKQGIREKSIEVGEKYLFDLFYDYDSSFAHGLWGAIRETSMLKCNNASHQYHIVPDIFGVQNLPDVKADCRSIMMRLLDLLKQNYEIPETLMILD